MRTRLPGLLIALLVLLTTVLAAPTVAAGTSAAGDGAPAGVKLQSARGHQAAVDITKASSGPALRSGYRPTPGLKYNVPRSAPKTQFRIERQLIAAINHTGGNQRIRMSFYSFDRYPVADALIRAKRRGVQVQLLLNNHEVTPAQRKLRGVLGTNRWNHSFIYQCKSGCRSPGEILHDKFVIISRSGQAEDVVMYGSVNMKLNGAKNQYNDLWTVNEAPKLYNHMDALFGQLRKDKRASPLFWHERVSDKYLVDAFPFPRPTPRRDPFMKILRPIKCFGARGPTGNADNRTIVRVNMHAWDGYRGTYIARRLRYLYAEGCDVKLQYGYGGLKVRQVLGQATRRGRVPVRSSGLDTNGDGQIDLYTHMKNLIVSGHYGDDRSARFVVTGSSNHQDSGASGDEINVRMFGGFAARSYTRQWNWMWTKRTRPVTYLNSRVIVDGEPVNRTVIAQPFGIDSPEWRDE